MLSSFKITGVASICLKQSVFTFNLHYDYNLTNTAKHNKQTITKWFPSNLKITNVKYCSTQEYFV